MADRSGEVWEVDFQGQSFAKRARADVGCFAVVGKALTAPDTGVLWKCLSLVDNPIDDAGEVILLGEGPEASWEEYPKMYRRIA